MIENIIVFSAMFIVDLLNVIFVKHIQKNNAFFAASTALFLFLTYSIAVVSYVDNRWLLIPAGIGAFMGTFVGIKLNKWLLGRNG